MFGDPASVHSFLYSKDKNVCGQLQLSGTLDTDCHNNPSILDIVIDLGILFLYLLLCLRAECDGGGL